MSKYSQFAQQLVENDLQVDYSLSEEQQEANRSGTLVPQNYTVTDFENDQLVLKSYETLTDYLAEDQSVARYAIDQATTGQTDDPAEYMRDLTVRIGAPLSLAASLKNAPEHVKQAYRTMKARWDKASVTGAGERFDQIKDYGSDLLFSPEGLATVAGLLSGATTFGAGTAATVAGRKAAQQAAQSALTRAVQASAAAVQKNPLTAATLYGGSHGLASTHLAQELDISADIINEEDYSVGTTLTGGAMGAALGYALPKAVGLYMAGRHGNKAFRESTEVGPVLSRDEAAARFDETLEGEWIPASGGSLVDEVNRLGGPEGATARTVDGTDTAGSRTFDMDDEGLNAAASKFAEDLGGGEKTRREILAAIRQAADNETTVSGRTNAIKQSLYTIASDLSGNFYGKAAGVLSPIVKFSGTAAQLQKKLSYEFGIKYKVQDEVVQKDLSEVQREITGKYNEQFRAIVDTLSLSKIDTKLATDINDALSKSMRSTKPINHAGFDDATNQAINKAALEVRDLYNEMGVRLQKIGVIDKLQKNYVPRMWSRSAIEKNQEGLIQKFIDNAGMSRAKAEATVRNMLDVKNQVDAGGGGGYFFSAKRKINTIGNDADFEEFLNSDVLGSLHAYTFQAGKSLAKHRVLGVTNYSDFRRFYVNRIKAEMKEAGQEFTPKIEQQLERLYRTATGEGMERYGRKVQTAVDAYSFTNRVALLGLATVSSLTEVFINISKAGVRNSVKGFSDAMNQAHKRITGDLESELMNKHGMTAAEALTEMRNFSIHVDQALAQVGDRLAGDELMTEGLQNASNKFFRLNMLDQWTKFVQNVSHSSGKALINENIEKLALRYKNRPLDKQGEILAGELAELGIDFKKAVKWYDNGANRADDFYKNDFLGGAARYTNSVVLQPTALSGLKPLLFSNPKTAVLFQLLSYPAAFTNTVLKGAAKSFIKSKTRNSGKILAAGAIMTGMARWTNYLRTGGESERNKDMDEIIGSAIARWGGNGLLLDSFQRAKTASKYTKSNLSYATMPFGPAASDAISLIQQGIIPTIGNKAPVLSGSYFGDTLIGEQNVDRYKRGLRKAQTDVFGGLIEQFEEPPRALKYSVGGKVAAAASKGIMDLFKKTSTEIVEEPMPLVGDIVGTLKTSTKGLIDDKALSDTADRIEGSINLGVSEGAIKFSPSEVSDLTEANITTLIGTKKGSTDITETNANFQAALKEKDLNKARANLREYQKDLGYTDKQIAAFNNILDIEDIDGSKVAVKSTVFSEIEDIKSAFDDFNIEISKAERTRAEKAKFDEESLDATHDFLTAIIKDKEPLISAEGAPIVARDAIVKIAANGNVNFSKFKAPRLSPTEKPDLSLTEDQLQEALENFTKDSIEKNIIYRSVRTFTNAEFNVSYPFSREIGTHVGTEGVAKTIKLRDMIFDVYDGKKAANMYLGFKNRKPSKGAFESRFDRLQQVADLKDKKVSENTLQAGYINIKKPLMYEGETAVNSWSADKMLADIEGINELLVNIEKSGVSITDKHIKSLKSLRTRALDLQTRPSESLVERLETDLMKNELNIDFREALKSMGFDSIKYKNEIEHGFKGESEFSYILFDPEQFKMTTAAKFDSSDARHSFAAGSIAVALTKAFAPKKASGFFSKAEKASQKLEGSKPKPGQSFLNELQNKHQVTPDELEWTGANAKFGNNKPTTKEDVQQFFKESDFDFDVNVGRHRPDEIEAVDDMPTVVRDNNEENLFDEWLEENRPFEKEMLDDLLGAEDEAAWDDLFEELFEEWQATTGGAGDFATQPYHLDYAFEGQATKNYREVVLTLKNQYKKVDTDYTHPHHPDLKNQIAHIRLADADQVDDAFNKTLLIDEIQSDAHQAAGGKPKNYLTLDKEAELKAQKDKLKAEEERIRNSDMSEEEKYDELDMLLASRELDAVLGESPVPDLPLKKEKQWGALALRQAMKIAAEEGYDQVALTTGRLQAIRNEKLKEAKGFELSERPNIFGGDEDVFVVEGFSTDNFNGPSFDLGVYKSQEAMLDKLPKLIGEENTQKLLNATPDDEGLLRIKANQDIRFGGQKYEEFYDKTLMKIWKKEFADKYGAKIKMVAYKQGDKTVKLPTLEITDKMREDIQRGLLMFVEGGEVISEQAEAVAASEPVPLMNPEPTPKASGRTVSALRANLQRKVA